MYAQIVGVRCLRDSVYMLCNSCEIVYTIIALVQQHAC